VVGAAEVGAGFVVDFVGAGLVGAGFVVDFVGAGLGSVLGFVGVDGLAVAVGFLAGFGSALGINAGGLLLLGVGEEVITLGVVTHRIEESMVSSTEDRGAPLLRIGSAAMVVFRESIMGLG
jgi:hypothetical protein